MSNLYSSGPRLIEPSGDPRRQAVDSLRGYAYQLYVSALAWLRLKSEERLHLEVAEDYAIAASGALEGVQVKDTQGSGGVTINSEDVRDALDNFIDLVERNPQTDVTLRFLSTASIGVEKEVTHRANGEAVLLYWRRAAQGADVKPLRDALLRARIKDRARTFIESRDDEALRRDLLRRIHWDCGNPGLEEVKLELSSALVEYGNERLKLSPRDSAALPAIVLGGVLDTVLLPVAKDRRLDAAALLRLCDEFTRTSLPKSTLEALIGQLLPQQEGSAAAGAVRTVLEPEDQVPMPAGLLLRQKVVQAIRDALESSPVVFLTAGTGMGKTVVARLTARAHGGRWMLLDLRDLAADESEFRLQLALGQAAVMPLTGIIVDDLNVLDTPKVAAAFARLVHSLRRRDAACLVTSYREVPSGLLDKMGLAEATTYRVPTLDETEVAALVHAAGGDPATWTRLIYASGGRGHPQLVRVVLAGLRRRGWPMADLGALASLEKVGEDLESEREAVRRRLVLALDNGPRCLLYRTSLLVGRFKRPLVLELGAIEPRILSAGECLDTLVGPWIDAVGSSLFRVSPLVASAGESVLLPAEQLAVHEAVARSMLQGAQLDVTIADELFVHGLKGRCDDVLHQLALAVIMGADANRSTLAQWLPSLRFAATDKPIYQGASLISRSLRLAQFLLVASLDTDGERPQQVWAALEKEMADELDRAEATKFETLALGKAMMASNLPAVLPSWFELLRRLKELFRRNELLARVVADAEHSAPTFEGAKSTFISAIFVGHAMHLRSVDEQLKLFKDLNALSADERQDYLGATLTRGGTTAIVNGPWLAESRRGTLDGRAASQAYQEIAALARHWGNRHLTAAFLVATSVMLDEYAGDDQAALSILKAGEEEFGIDLDLARARAKVYFRQRRHDNVLSIVRDIEGQIGKLAPTERLFLCRETAISFAETGNWNSAAEWFGKAHSDSLAITGTQAKALALGLKADQALALFRAGEVATAVELYLATLEKLGEVDADDSLEAAYCSRVVRHGLLWLYGEATGTQEQLIVGEQPATMVAGMCSNPNPPEAIKKQPLAPLDTAWYLFAAVECLAAPPPEALSRLAARLKGRSIPSLELMVRHSCLAISIRQMHANGFASQVERWMDFLAYWLKNRVTMGQFKIESPEYGAVPRATSSELEQTFVVVSLQSAVTAFGVAAATTGKAGQLQALQSEFRDAIGLYEAKRLVDAMVSVPAGGDGQSLPDFAAAAIRNVLARHALSPEQLLDATLRFVQVAHRSKFRSSIEEPVVEWARNSWSSQIQSRFAFRNPNLVIPAIRETLARPGLAGIAAAIVAAEPGLQVRLGHGLHDYLRDIASEPPNSKA